MRYDDDREKNEEEKQANGERILVTARDLGEFLGENYANKVEEMLLDMLNAQYSAADAARDIHEYRRNKYKDYTVFVDGTEVNDIYLTLEQAKQYHEEFTADGYAPHVYEVELYDDGERDGVRAYIHVPVEGDKM